ncbi:hypothetical protein B296_00036287 [Ensete ventricosum]|uniref:Uncharacterized protein n=1 Tax=Ensete ventricosum TaxID=4639 RepID=A0A426WXK7_ENSVE|nr:hypothetical protein B296_00036287 [Ensete ventricosum]
MGWPQLVVPADVAPVGCCPCEEHRPPLRIAAPVSDAGLPCGLALAAAGHPLAGGLSRGLAVGGRPCMGADCTSSSLPSLQKRSKNA